MSVAALAILLQRFGTTIEQLVFQEALGTLTGSSWSKRLALHGVESIGRFTRRRNSTMWMQMRSGISQHQVRCTCLPTLV